MAENFFGNTDTGKMRDNNEDAFLAEKAEQFILGCVIDGVGGYEGGEVAAHIAKETIHDHFQKNFTDVVSTMKAAITAANEKIYHERSTNKEHESMACVLTLAVADVNNNQFHYAHIGDTRLYLFRDKSLVKVTKDHSFVGFLEDSKRLSEEEAMRHPKRNEINKALGFDPHMVSQDDYIETGTSPFLPGDMLLLCSDGLTDLVKANTISSILSSNNSLEEKCNALINAANDAGGKDNITVVLLQNDKKPLKQRATKPIAIKKNNESQEPEKITEESKEKIAVEQVKTRRRTALISLRLLSLLMLAVIAWLLIEKYYNGAYSKAPVVPKKQNAVEQKLQLDINSAKDTLVLNSSNYKSPIVFDSALFISNDSLIIRGNGITLRSDSLYKGTAIFVADNCRYILLDSLVLENFDVGVMFPGNVLHLKNVRFRKCNVPLSSQLKLAADTLTNWNNDSVKINSLPVKPRQ